MAHSIETAENNTTHETWKHLLPPPAKIIHLFNLNFMKGILVICAFTVFSLLYFSVNFPGVSKWRADCDAAAAAVHTASLAGLTSVDDGETNISHVYFGVGGSAETWGSRRRYCELWWRHNITRGHVWLDEPPTGPWPETSPPYRISAETDRFRYTNPYGSRSAVRMARILKESFDMGLENVRWFVMGDDDTVFFSENLMTVLNKYDHRQMYYIGCISESVEQDLVHSYTMGYGGGGFAVSRPLAAALVGILDRCLDRYAEAYGSDQKIGACINEIGVPVTKELGFHQMDIRGRAYGLLSAHPMAPLVSLHHLDYIQPLFPGQNRAESIKRLMRAYRMDPGRTLQHTFCYNRAWNWTVSVSWGYTVQLYPFLMTAKDMSTPIQTFLTWGTWSQEPFTFNTRVMSPEPCERPIIFYYDRAEKLANGTLTTYKRRRSDQKKQCDNQSYARGYNVKGFNVSAQIFDPKIWNKAPRRQCCQIMGGSDQSDGVVQVRIRPCNQDESVTPP